MPFHVQGSFVSQKISKVRWIPEDYVETKSFLTGSWDDEINSIKVWSFEATGEENENDEPRPLSEYRIGGDVTEVKFIDKSRIVVSSSDGEVKILEISAYDKQTPLRELHVWKKLHNYGSDPCSCTALDVLEGDIASVGEDGSINILNPRRGDVSRTVANADSCSLQSVCLKHSELITGNIRGHMKVWDLRTPSDNPTSSFLLSGDEQAATCIVNHPTQPHIILVGSEAGSLGVWDLRMKSYPASLLNAHASAITEMQFHPENPQKLLSCSASGEIWDWNMEMMTKSTNGPDAQVTVWKPVTDKSNMVAESLMPCLHNSVNTLDCDKGRVLCGTDNEAVYLIKNLNY